MPLADWIGAIAATLTSASFVPQMLQTFRSKDASGISLGMYSAFTVGVALWLVYGLLLGAWPVVIANAITWSLALCILVMKLRYRLTCVASGTAALFVLFTATAGATIVAPWADLPAYSLHPGADVAPEFKEVIDRPHGVGKGVHAGLAHAGRGIVAKGGNLQRTGVVFG